MQVGGAILIHTPPMLNNNVHPLPFPETPMMIQRRSTCRQAETYEMLIERIFMLPIRRLFVETYRLLFVIPIAIPENVIFVICEVVPITLCGIFAIQEINLIISDQSGRGRLLLNIVRKFFILR